MIPKIFFFRLERDEATENGWRFHDERFYDFQCSQYFSGYQIKMKVKHVERTIYKLDSYRFLWGNLR